MTAVRKNTYLIGIGSAFYEEVLVKKTGNKKDIQTVIDKVYPFRRHGKRFIDKKRVFDFPFELWVKPWMIKAKGNAFFLFDRGIDKRLKRIFHRKIAGVKETSFRNKF